MANNTTKTTSRRKTVTAKKTAPKHIGLVQKDAYLEPFEDAIRGRHDHAEWKKNQLTNNGKRTLEAFASGYDYYGLHKMKKDGCSENGHRTPLTYISWETSTTGRRTKDSALRE